MQFPHKRFFQKSTESALLVYFQNKVLIYFNLFLIQQKKVHQNHYKIPVDNDIFEIKSFP
jgi:hypothetical protein